MATLQGELAVTCAELAAARAEIVELKAQLANNSQHSSKPPSSDVPGTRPAKPKGRKRRKRGGQPGPRIKPSSPQHVALLHLVRATLCDSCQAELETAEPTGSVRPYVYELPPIWPRVHQDQGLDLACKLCGRVTPAPLPQGVPKGQYDPSVQAMTALLRGELRQRVRQTSAVMTKGMHGPMSPAMVAKTQQKVSAALGLAVAQAMDYAQTHARSHANESIWPLGKKKGWLWVAVCELVTVGFSKPYTVLAAQFCFRPMFSEALSHLCRVSFESAERLSRKRRPGDHCAVRSARRSGRGPASPWVRGPGVRAWSS